MPKINKKMEPKLCVYFLLISLSLCWIGSNILKPGPIEDVYLPLVASEALVKRIHNTRQLFNTGQHITSYM